jgi:hypothetical protein
MFIKLYIIKLLSLKRTFVVSGTSPPSAVKYFDNDVRSTGLMRGQVCMPFGHGENGVLRVLLYSL